MEQATVALYEKSLGAQRQLLFASVNCKSSTSFRFFFYIPYFI